MKSFRSTIVLVILGLVFWGYLKFYDDRFAGKHSEFAATCTVQGCGLSPRLSRKLAHLSPINDDWPPFAGAASTSGQAGAGAGMGAAAGEAGQQRVGGRRLAGWKAAKLT